VCNRRALLYQRLINWRDQQDKKCVTTLMTIGHIKTNTKAIHPNESPGNTKGASNLF